MAEKLSEAQRKVLGALANGAQLRRAACRGTWACVPDNGMSTRVPSATVAALIAKGLLKTGWEVVGAVETADINSAGRALLEGE